MTRRYSIMGQQAVRQERQCGLVEANNLVIVSKLLDKVEAATTFEELRDLLRQFISYETGIE